MSLKDKFVDELAELSADELDKLENMEIAINEDNQGKRIKLMVLKDQR
ncbi:hypothetical protein BX659_106127 [Orenia metallireducens]|jgi:hypothetical protein|uniref:Uncharacterized protein n=1 Tax=Orenia metallireducens TaxID=1413210 RepID=A0A285GVQ4_9FIRM|nr:hypothetical protein [Orenia metallireducens]PRX31093.1 hypothetical protein BX659_106127 [Orenia metallireducens]SNY27639.1 hypothetical protein SAMN06265827_11159 [Orenia metallireducens]